MAVAVNTKSKRYARRIQPHHGCGGYYGVYAGLHLASQHLTKRRHRYIGMPAVPPRLSQHDVAILPVRGSHARDHDQLVSLRRLHERARLAVGQSPMTAHDASCQCNECKEFDKEYLYVGFGYVNREWLRVWISAIAIAIAALVVGGFLGLGRGNCEDNGFGRITCIRDE